jgi:hypothetical protein
MNRKAKKNTNNKYINFFFQIRLILQNYYLDHETYMTLSKAYLKKKSKILNQTNIEGWNWEKNINKKNIAKQKKIAIKKIRTKFDIKN